jgi:hypothetical protein
MALVIPRRFRASPVLVLGLLVSVALAATPVALSAKSHRFTAGYTGKGSGAVHGKIASGSATMVGRGKPIGRGTLKGSARGVFTSRTCVLFSGTAVLKGTAGSIRLSAHRARACVSGTNPSHVSFSGRASVSHGTAKFKGAHGLVSFHGTYARNSGAVTISLTGELTYENRSVTAGMVERTTSRTLGS